MPVHSLCTVHAMQLNWHFSSVQFSSIHFSSVQFSSVLSLCTLFRCNWTGFSFQFISFWFLCTSFSTAICLCLSVTLCWFSSALLPWVPQHLSADFHFGSSSFRASAYTANPLIMFWKLRKRLVAWNSRNAYDQWSYSCMVRLRRIVTCLLNCAGYKHPYSLTHSIYAMPVISTWMGDCLRAGKPSRYVTNHRGWLSILPSVGW